jgi:hypothetical protein
MVFLIVLNVKPNPHLASRNEINLINPMVVGFLSSFILREYSQADQTNGDKPFQ